MTASSDLLELLPSHIRPQESTQQQHESLQQVHDGTNKLQIIDIQVLQVPYADAFASIFRKAGDEGSVFVVCGTVFIMQEVAETLGLVLPETDPLETNERRMLKMK